MWHPKFYNLFNKCLIIWLKGFFFPGETSLEHIIKQRQEGRVKQMDSFLDDLAAKYGQKSKGTKKRKATTSAETTGKNKRKRK